jgi:hypothetical protein
MLGVHGMARASWHGMARASWHGMARACIGTVDILDKTWAPGAWAPSPDSPESIESNGQHLLSILSQAWAPSPDSPWSTEPSESNRVTELEGWFPLGLHPVWPLSRPPLRPSPRKISQYKIEEIYPTGALIEESYHRVASPVWREARGVECRPHGRVFPGQQGGPRGVESRRSREEGRR